MIYAITIPDWHPTPLNKLLGGHWAKGSRLKKIDRGIVAAHALMARIPPATGKRRLQLRIVLGPKQRACDSDAYFKSLCDALVHCKLLLDDNRQNVELAPVLFDRADRRRTEIVLQDV